MCHVGAGSRGDLDVFLSAAYGSSCCLSIMVFLIFVALLPSIHAVSISGHFVALVGGSAFLFPALQGYFAWTIGRVAHHTVGQAASVAESIVDEAAVVVEQVALDGIWGLAVCLRIAMVLIAVSLLLLCRRALSRL